MKKSSVDSAQLNELIYQALETELGGVQVYETALRCAVNEDLRKELGEYLEQTKRHVQVITHVCESLGLDTAVMTPGRKVVRHQGQALVKAMEMALAEGDATNAELVACECVVLAETKDHSNWELMGLLAEKGSGDTAKVLRQAYESVEQEEDHHLYHTMGWSRELWIQALGLPAVLPPPEEVRKVETAIGASRAEQARDQMQH
ncbi:MAG TPA: hypothetical protein VFM73_09500 [Xanthomonadaceae bacterium]|nr:hypothetical protein [Xanthomonadaceae bacterium]